MGNARWDMTDGWTATRTRRDVLRQTGLAGIALASGPLLAACGGGGDDGGRATVDFWDMQWGGDAYERTARELVREFTRTHPEIDVEYRLVPWTNFYEVFSTAVASGTTPDVSTGATFQAFEFADAIEPVDDLVEEWRADGTTRDLPAAAIPAQRDAEGTHTGLPWGIETRVINYRRDRFREAGVPLPRSLEEIGEAARALTRDGRYGLGFSSETMGSQMLMSLFQNNGGGLFTTACGPSIAGERNREVCVWVQELVRDGAIPRAAAGWTSDDLLAAMQSGEIAMSYNSPNWFRQMGDAMSQIGILSPPTGFHGDRGTLIWHLPLMRFRSAGDDRDAVATFMRWWLEHSQALWERGEIAALPARASFHEEIETLHDPRVQLVLDEWIAVGRNFFAPCDHSLPVLNRVEGQGFLQTLTQDVLTLRDVDASLEEADRTLAQLTTNGG